jgi:hypothetical protein
MKTLLVLLLGVWSVAQAKPIAYAQGTTFMAEYGSDLMQESQLFYAPRYDFSYGGGLLRMEARDRSFDRQIAYLRANWLAKRWNLPSAQGNVFAFGGLGQARGSDFSGTRTAYNAGLQADYETRRIYMAAKFDWQGAPSAFAEQVATVQAGFAPYKHDWDVAAIWLLLQARHYREGMLDDQVQTAALIRWFKGNTWIEGGLTDDGRLQAMLMLNF